MASLVEKKYDLVLTALKVKRNRSNRTAQLFTYSRLPQSAESKKVNEIKQVSKKSKVSISWTPINCSQINAERESAVDFTAPFLESGAGDDNSGALVICCQLFNSIMFIGIMTVMAVMGLVAGDDNFGECSMSNFSTTISCDTRNCHTGS